jgi:type II secretion system protein H
MRLTYRQPGFTLLELVLVLVIICTVLAIASPSLRGWSKGSALRDTAEQMVALARLARSQAVATAQLHRLCLEPATGRYRLMVRQGQEFVPVPSSFADAWTLPDGYRLELTLTAQAQENCIEFYPTGRTQPGRIRIVSDQGEVMEIACATPAEPFQIVEPEGGRR